MMIKWWKPSINIKNFEKIKDIAKRGWPNQGKYSNILENKIKSLLKVKHCLTCTSGTSAIYLAIKALKLKKNSEILLPNIIGDEVSTFRLNKYLIMKLIIRILFRKK